MSNETKCRADFIGSIDELCLHEELKMHVGEIGGSHSCDEKSMAEEPREEVVHLLRSITVAAIFVYPIKSCAGRIDYTTSSRMHAEIDDYEH